MDEVKKEEEQVPEEQQVQVSSDPERPYSDGVIPGFPCFP